MPPTRDEMQRSIQLDYPNMPPDFIALVLDMWEKDPLYVQNIIAQEKKKQKLKHAPPPKTQLTVKELEELNEKFKLEQEKILGENKEHYDVEVNETISGGSE